MPGQFSGLHVSNAKPQRQRASGPGKPSLPGRGGGMTDFAIDNKLYVLASLPIIVEPASGAPTAKGG